MKRVISIAAAALIILSAMLLVSCDGKKTYTFSSVKASVDAGALQPLIGDYGSKDIEEDFASKMKGAVLEIDGSAATITHEGKSTVLNCTRNGSRLDFSGEELAGLFGNIQNGLEMYIVESGGAELVIRYSTDESGYSLAIKVRLIFK